MLCEQLARVWGRSRLLELQAVTLQAGRTASFFKINACYSMLDQGACLLVLRPILLSTV